MASDQRMGVLSGIMLQWRHLRHPSHGERAETYLWYAGSDLFSGRVHPLNFVRGN